MKRRDRLFIVCLFVRSLIIDHRSLLIHTREVSESLQAVEVSENHRVAVAVPVHREEHWDAKTTAAAVVAVLLPVDVGEASHREED